MNEPQCILNLPCGDLATWVGAIAASVAAIGTIATVIWAVKSSLDEARHARRRSQEEHDERVRAQAQKVYAWSELRGEDTVDVESRTVHVAANRVLYGNASAEPVYNAVLHLVWVQGAGPKTGEDLEAWGRSTPKPAKLELNARRVFQVLPPGRFVTDLRGVGNSPPGGRTGVEVGFTDHVGRHWIRRATGALEQIQQSPIDHYQIPRPLNYSSAEALD
ncbi:MAG TPA: hypothetical protein VF299_08560 [Mycobacterium sp.]